MNRLMNYIRLGLVVVAAGCSGGPSENDGPVSEPAPAHPAQLRVQTAVKTRSAVDGTVLPRGSAIGVVVTTEEGSGWFTPSATSGSGSADGGYYSDGRNVRFVNETGENTWTSTTADGKTRLLLFSGSERGRVYGYYPWTDDADIRGEGSSATVPVGILNEGAIVVDAAGATAGTACTAADEIDYMYSSHRDVVGAGTTTTARLVMEHVLARISFRMYASSGSQAAVEGDAESYYEFAGYTLKNRNGSEELVANFDENTRLSVATGEITGAVSGGQIVRRIEGCRLERSKGDTPEDDGAAAAASARVGNLCFPLAAIGHDGGKSTGIEIVFEVRRMNGDGTVASGAAAYALPLAVVPGESDKWEAGKHYTYTVKFTGSSLSVESVTVTRWNEVAGGDMNIGEDPYVSSAEVSPEGDIPGLGGAYGITLEGLLSIHGTEVRARVDGQEETLAEGLVAESGETVELTIPANASYDARTVVFEYKLNDTWVKIAECSQGGYSVVETTGPLIVSGGEGTYSFTLTGYLPSEGVEIRAISDGETLAKGRVTALDASGSLALPANMTGQIRFIDFEYKWKTSWVKFDSNIQRVLDVGHLYGGGVVYWVNPSNAKDFRVVAMDYTTKLKWAANSNYVLGSGAQSETARNGASLWKIAKSYSDNKTGGASGNFATDFPAFAYCYNKTDGGVAKGTWYLPSLQELKELDAVVDKIKYPLSSNDAMNIVGVAHWAATERSGNTSYAMVERMLHLEQSYYNKTLTNYTRCVRSK
nr:fimbrillin family protein [uncultured Alistipes sp.]